MSSIHTFTSVHNIHSCVDSGWDKKIIVLLYDLKGNNASKFVAYSKFFFDSESTSCMLKYIFSQNMMSEADIYVSVPDIG